MLTGITLFLVESLVYLALGKLNGDERWHLYGSQLVIQEWLPVRDFACPPMPLFPNACGIPQILGTKACLQTRRTLLGVRSQG